jgi:hypothetical protein
MFCRSSRGDCRCRLRRSRTSARRWRLVLTSPWNPRKVKTCRYARMVGRIRQTMPSASLTAMEPPVTCHCQRSATTAGGTWITFPQPATCCQWRWPHMFVPDSVRSMLAAIRGRPLFTWQPWGCGFSAWTSIHGRSRRLANGSPMPHHSVVPSSSSLIFCGDRVAAAGSLDVVVLNRFLTCLPAVEDWQDALSRALELLTEGGLIYVGDFLLMPACPAQSRPLSAGSRQRWPLGATSMSSTIRAGQASSLITTVCRKLRRMVSPYRVLCLRRFSTLSRHGHASRMFELIGVNERRPA